MRRNMEGSPSMEGVGARRSVPGSGGPPSVPFGSRIGIRGGLSCSVEVMPEPRTLASRIARRENAEFVGRSANCWSPRPCSSRTRPPASCSSTAPAGSVRASCCARSAAVVIAPAGRRSRSTRVTCRPCRTPSSRRCAGAWKSERPLVLIDTYERMSALGGYLRSTLLPSLPAGAVVVVGGRDAPEPGWFEGGWETVALELALAPLSERERARCSPATGCDDARAAARSRAGQAACRWRCGSARPPLATTRVDARASGALRRICGGCPRPRSSSPTVRARVRRARGHSRAAGRRPARARRRAALRWLAGCAFADARAGGVTLHELVRRPLRAELQRARTDLRARVAVSLHSRALGDQLTIDLADLVEDPAVRAGYSWDGASTTT